MNKAKIFTAALTLAILLAVYLPSRPAVANNETQMKELKAASDRGDYAKVLEIVQPLAEAGDDKFQSILGAMYAEGKGVAQDYKKAREWFDTRSVPALQA